jgi:hypothetical protein
MSCAAFSFEAKVRRRLWSWSDCAGGLPRLTASPAVGSIASVSSPQGSIG